MKNGPLTALLRLSLAARLLLSATLVFVVAGTVAIVISLRYDAEHAHADLQRELDQALHTLPVLIGEPVVIGDYASLQQVLDRFVQHPLVSRASFRDSNGIVLTSADHPLDLAAPDWFVSIFSAEALSGKAPIVIGERNYGELSVSLTAVNQVNRAWQRTLFNCSIVAAAIMIGALLLRAILHAGMAPIWRLEVASARLADGDFSIRVEEAGAPEIRHLIGAFNRMAGDIEAAQLHLAESERRVRLALDAAHMAAWHWDAGSGRLTWGENPEKLLGPRPELGYPEFPQMVVAEDRDSFVAAGKRALETGDEYDIEFRLQRTDGEVRWIAARGRVEKDTHGGAIAIRGVSTDISARKADEAELAEHRRHLEDLVAARTMDLSLARDAAEAASRAKSTFLANMSHEIRTPLNAVIGLTHLLLRQSPSPEQRDKLDKIDGAARHLLGVLNGILDLSKIEAGRMQLDRQTFDPQALADDIERLLGERIAAKGLRYVSDIAGLPPSLIGDPTRLSQALINFVGNAIKFTERGSITLRVRRLDENGRRVLLRFSVIDTGRGIPHGKAGDIFEAFEQADASTTREHGGTGLGLAITRHIARLMGGDAGVDSVPGEGSTFWFTAWLECGEATVTSHGTDTMAGRLPEERLRSKFAACRLLLAEDDAINQQVALELLREAAGLSVDLAVDGYEAVRMAEALPYDLILMDMQMPVMDGVEAARAIRALPAHAHTPILAMTANAFADDRRRCIEAGMDDHIAKPVDPDVLFETLLRWLPSAVPATN